MPFGRYARIGYTRDFTPYREVFADWTFTSRDVEMVPIDRSDFIYADPPYDVEFTQYAKGGFTWDDQQRTAEWLARHRGPVVLVNQATPRIEALYRKLEIQRAVPRRSHAASVAPATGRQPAKSWAHAICDAPEHEHRCRARGDGSSGAERGGYSCDKQVRVGTRCGGGVTRSMQLPRNSEKVLVSLKWQQTGGTAEQKVPFEVMCLADAVRAEQASRAYLVLGGDGWTLRDYYTSGALAEHLVHASFVQVVTLEAFIRLANNGKI